MAASRSISVEDHAARGFDPAESAGLFVGVSHFEDPRFAPVPFAVDDAVDLAFVFSVELGLIRPGKCVLALAGEPRKPETVERLAQLLAAGAQQKPAIFTNVYRLLGSQRAAARAGGLFVVAVATHGLSDQGGDFLVAADSLRERVVKTGVAVDELFDEVAKAGAQRRLVLLDACRERLSADTRGAGALSAMGQRFADAIAKASGQVVLAGATLGGFAYDDHERRNGVFTAAVLDGLRGAAPADGRGFITARTLADFVHERVLEWVKAHRPEHSRRSAGIARRIEGAAEMLPLAVNPAVKETAETNCQRQEVAEPRTSELDTAQLTGAGIERGNELLKADGARPWTDTRLTKQRVSVSGYGLKRPNLKHRNNESHSVAEAWISMILVVVFGLVMLGIWLFRQPDITLSIKEILHGKPSSSVPITLSAGDLHEGHLGIRFRYVPPGTYLIGSPSAEMDTSGVDGLRQVTLASGLWLGESEVTKAQWRALVGNNPSYFAACSDDCPVESVNWYEAVTFANLLSAHAGLESCYEIAHCEGTLGGQPLEGFACGSVRLRGVGCLGYRLPGEAEWEVGVRAGEFLEVYLPASRPVVTPIAANLDEVAWYQLNSWVEYAGGGKCSRRVDRDRKEPSELCGPHPVRRKQPNRWQFYDLLGNVKEWAWDEHNPNGVAIPMNLSGPGRRSYRVIRGGAWSSTARLVRAAARSWLEPGYRHNVVGFRLARGQLRQE